MSASSKRGIAVLVTGTDLGVGKTYVAAGLARLLRDRGIDVGVMKPVEVGWPKNGGEWPTDADTLRAAAEVDDPVEDVVPYIYEDMLAPQVAADKARRPIELEVIKEALDRLRSRHEVVFVEGAGGICVPLDDGIDLASLAEACDLPVLIVAHAHIGTLNHTYLTVHYAQSRGLKIVGIVANRLDRSADDPTTPTNAKMMERMCKVPVLGVVPFTPEADTLEDVVKHCSSCFDVEKFLEGLGLTEKSGS